MKSNVTKLHKYIALWFVLGLVMSVIFANSMTTMVVLLSATVLWFFLAGTAVYNPTNHLLGVFAMMVTCALFSAFCLIGLVSAPAPFIVGIGWFGIIMGLFAILDYAMNHGDEVIRWVFRVLYGFFAFTTFLVLWGASSGMYHQLQRFIPSAF